MADDSFDDLGSKVSYLVVKSGIPVFAKDGEKLGTVVRSLAAPEADLFDGVIFDTTPHKPGGHKFVDAPEVDSLYERGVVLTIDRRRSRPAGGAGQEPRHDHGLRRRRRRRAPGRLHAARLEPALRQRLSSGA